MQYKHLTFPLKINGIYQAQQNSTDFIMKQLPMALITA
jgi:hypothetical protein